MERTLSIIKPDAVASGATGQIIAMLEAAELRVVALKTLRLSPVQAEGFYAVHRERPFFHDLCTFMSSGPVHTIVLEGPNAIAANRSIMGATDPAQAADKTIRKRFGTNIEHNAVHGSDAPESAQSEIGYFFSDNELRCLAV